MAIVYPDTVKDVGRRGHTIGGHTWSHANLGAKSLEGGVAEVERGFSAISAALGGPIAPFFRFPYLSDPDAMIEYLKRRNVAIWGIDVDSYDTRGFSSTRIARWTLDHVKQEGKGIILFHDIKGTTQRALPEVLDELKRAGFKVVHLKPKSMLATETAQDAAIAAVFDSSTGKRLTAGERKERKGKQPTLAAISTDEDALEQKRSKRQKIKRAASKRKKRSTEAELPVTSVASPGRGT
jgi:hypothetical protein